MNDQSTNRNSWNVLAVVAIMIFSANIFFTHVIMPYVSKSMTYHDFYPIIAASQVIRDGKNPYEPGVIGDQIMSFRAGHPTASGYLYPTFWAHAVTPLSALSILTAQKIWHLFNIVFFILIIAISIRLFVSRRYYIYAWAFSLGVFTLFQPIFETIYVGQVNLFVTLMIVLGVYFASVKKPWIAGIFLAIGAMVKLWPLVILYYFLLRWNWRVLLASFLTFLFILTGSFALTSYAVQWDYFTNRLPHTVLKGNTKPVSSIHNVSLKGLVNRAFTTEASDAMTRGRVMKYQPGHVIGLNPESTDWPFLFLVLASLAGISCLTYGHWSGRNAIDHVETSVHVSIFILFLAIFSSFFTEHYLVLLMFPYLAIFLAPPLREYLYRQKILLALTVLSFFLVGFLHHDYDSYYRLWTDRAWGVLFFQPQIYGLLMLFSVFIAIAISLRKKDYQKNKMRHYSKY